MTADDKTEKLGVPAARAAVFGKGIGWYCSTVALLELVASAVAGLLWDRVGHTAVFYYGAIFAFAGSIGLVVLIPKRDHPSGKIVLSVNA